MPRLTWDFARIPVFPAQRGGAPAGEPTDSRHAAPLPWVRADADAALAAARNQATAYAHGTEIVLGAAVRPGTPDGRRVIAHEYAHVLQQTAFGLPPGTAIQAEADAERFAAAALAGRPARVQWSRPVEIARQAIVDPAADGAALARKGLSIVKVDRGSYWTSQQTRWRTIAAYIRTVAEEPQHRAQYEEAVQAYPDIARAVAEQTYPKPPPEPKRPDPHQVKLETSAREFEAAMDAERARLAEAHRHFLATRRFAHSDEFAPAEIRLGYRISLWDRYNAYLEAFGLGPTVIEDIDLTTPLFADLFKSSDEYWTEKKARVKAAKDRLNACGSGRPSGIKCQEEVEAEVLPYTSQGWEAARIANNRAYKVYEPISASGNPAAQATLSFTHVNLGWSPERAGAAADFVAGVTNVIGTSAQTVGMLRQGVSQPPLGDPLGNKPVPTLVLGEPQGGGSIGSGPPPSWGGGGRGGGGPLAGAGGLGGGEHDPLFGASERLDPHEIDQLLGTGPPSKPPSGPIQQRPPTAPPPGSLSSGPQVSIKDAQHPDRGEQTIRPHQVLEIGSGPVQTDLGLPNDPHLVRVTETDIAPTRAGVRKLDAEKALDPELVGQFDTVLINNPRHYKPNLPELAKALVAGGRIIMQGRAKLVGNQKEGFNPEFDQLYQDAVKAVQKANPGWSPKLGIEEPSLDPSAPAPKNPPPAKPGILPGGLEVRIDLTPGPGSKPTKPAHVMGGDFHRTTGVPSGGGPNARLIYTRTGPPQGGKR
jgi:hypothetical protein